MPVIYQTSFPVAKTNSGAFKTDGFYAQTPAWGPDAVDTDYPEIVESENTQISAGGGPAGENCLNDDSTDPGDAWVFGGTFHWNLGDEEGIPSSPILSGQNQSNKNWDASFGRLYADYHFDSTAWDLDFFYPLFSVAVGGFNYYLVLTAIWGDTRDEFVLSVFNAGWDADQDLYVNTLGGMTTEYADAKRYTKADFLDTWHRMELRWTCGTIVGDWTDVDNDGSYSVWIDDAQEASVTNIDLYISGAAYDVTVHHHQANALWIGHDGLFGRATNVYLDNDDPNAEGLGPLPTYEDPCSIMKPIWWGVIKGRSSTDELATFDTYKGGQMPQRDAATRFGGFKPPRLLSFSSMRRAASDWRTGAWQAQGGTIVWADTDRATRDAIETAETGSMLHNDYWHYLDAQEWREHGKNPWLVFQGPISRDTQVGDLTYHADVRDSIGEGYSIALPEAEIPNRKVWLDFGTYGYTDAGKFSIAEVTVPVIAGTHSDEATTQLGRVPLIYVGTMLCDDAVTRHVGLLCGHACKDGVINAYAMGGGPPEVNRIVWGTNAWAPGQTGWAAVNPTGASLYTDITNVDTLVRRYTILFFDDTGDTLGTDFSEGTQAIYANTKGFTVNPDGSGAEITGLHAQILHCFQNFFGWGGDNTGAPVNVWTSGDWLTSPTFEFYPGSGTLIERIDDQSFTDAATIGATYTAGNVEMAGAFVLAPGGKGISRRKFMAESALSGLMQYGWNVKYSQLFVRMFDARRTNFLADATTATDRLNVLAGTTMTIELQEELLVFAFLFGWDFNLRTNQYEQLDVTTAADGEVRARFGARLGPNEGYTMINDAVTAMAVGEQRFAFMRTVRYLVKWRETLCGLRHDLLGAVLMTHFAGRGSSGYQDRALYVQSHSINQDGTVDIEAYDVDDLLEEDV